MKNQILFVIRMILLMFIVDKVYYEAGIYTSVSIALIGISFEVQALIFSALIKAIKEAK